MVNNKSIETWVPLSSFTSNELYESGLTKWGLLEIEQFRKKHYKYWAYPSDTFCEHGEIKIVNGLGNLLNVDANLKVNTNPNGFLNLKTILCSGEELSQATELFFNLGYVWTDSKRKDSIEFGPLDEYWLSSFDDGELCLDEYDANEFHTFVTLDDLVIMKSKKDAANV